MFQCAANTAWRPVSRFGRVVIVVTVLALAACASWADAAKVTQQTFPSPEEAVKALVDAAKMKDTKALLAIFGPAGKGLINSGDKVADARGRERFVQEYETTHKLVSEGERKVILQVGKDDWPLPIPLVKQGEVWRFDTKAGKQEILNRRIGRNELSAVQVCRAFVDAQREYASQDRMGDGILQYAHKFLSEQGKKDGLYWGTKEGEEPSPLGPLVVKAVKAGYTRKQPGDQPTPYFGYFYKILKAQGKNAPGGAYDYVVNGKMIGGFALVAYPATYGNSGVMTFLVNQDGVVYQKNLGRTAEQIVKAMESFDPDPTWTKVE
jgi:hypothetical protein